MYNHPAPKFPNPIRVRDKRDGLVFDCTYSGYDPKYGRHLYTLVNVATKECHYQNPEGYIENKCEIVP
jgi:hypothetical protein